MEAVRKSVPPRVRSNGNRTEVKRGYWLAKPGLKFGFAGLAGALRLVRSLGANPCAAHSEGSVTAAGPITGVSFGPVLRQGALHVGSTIPRLSSSVRNVCSYVIPVFRL